MPHPPPHFSPPPPLYIHTDAEGQAVARLDIKGADEVGQSVDITVDYQGPTGELLTETNSVCCVFAALQLAARHV